MSIARYDAVVIGGGVNGLVAACLLRRAGKHTLLLEARPSFGGLAAEVDAEGRERAPSTALFGKPLSSRLIRALNLERYGLSVGPEPLDQILLLPGETPLHLPARMNVRAKSDLARRLPRDITALEDFRSRLARLSRALAPFLERRPPRIGAPSLEEKLEFLRLGFGLRRLGRKDMRDLLRIIAMNVADLVEEVFESAALQGLFGFDAVLGHNFGPRSPNTVFTLLHRWATAFDPSLGAPLRPRGGASALVAALVRAARGSGVELRPETPVAKILVERDRAVALRLASGEEIAAGLVLSSLHPGRSLIDLLGVEHLDSDMVRDLRHLRGKGCVATLQLELSASPKLDTPEAKGLESARIVHAPSLDMLERAHDAAKYGELPAQFPFEAAGKRLDGGRYLLQMTVQGAPHTLRDGGWTAQRVDLQERLVAQLTELIPGSERLIERMELKIPEDLERDLDLPGGHWHHVELSLDQSYLLRPTPGLARYATPVSGYWICGAATHPGGGISGAAGANAARAALALDGKGIDA